MIHFNIICDNAHEFDSWFVSNAAYEQQQQKGLVSCPVCGSVNVQKQLMAPAIPSRSNRQTDTAKKKAEQIQTAVLSDKNDPQVQALKQSIREIRRQVAENAEYVGEDFAKTAREIHNEEQPARGIYGEASLEDAQSLLEEGVDVLPLPGLPEDQN